MMRTVQLAIADAVYANALRDALTHTGPWRVETVERADPAQPCVAVLDETSFARMPLPLTHPERVVLISRQDPQLLAQAWDAGIVSVASVDDSLPTVLLAIMAASLRVSKAPQAPRGISPNPDVVAARLTPPESISRSKGCRTQ